MTAGTDDPLGVTALLDGDGRLLADLPAAVAERDVVVGEFLDEELGLAVDQREPLPGRQRRAAAGRQAWDVATAVARRHAQAFGYADLDRFAPEYHVVADLVDPERLYVELQQEDQPGDVQAFVVRTDGTVLHDHVDLTDDLHLVVLRDGDRARRLLTEALESVRRDRIPRSLLIHEGDGPPRRLRFTGTAEGVALTRGEAPPRHLDQSDIAAVVADLLR